MTDPGDVPPGPGWWKASDGNWYPPQPPPGTAPIAPPPPPGPPVKNTSGKGCLIAVLIVFGIFAVGAILLVVAITFLGHKAEDKLQTLGEAATTPQTVDPAHPGAREGDELLDVGEGARISGFTATVREARFAPSFEGLPDGSYLVLAVDLENRDDRAQQFDLTHWHVQQPDGALTTPVFGDQLTGGTIAPHDTIHGRLVFQVGDATGDYYVTYRPDILDRHRGIWTINR